jgi:hypothetical protein
MIEKNEHMKLSVDDDEVVNLLGIREQNWFPKVIKKELSITNNLDKRGQSDGCISEKLIEEEFVNIPEDTEEIKKETHKIRKRKSIVKKEKTEGENKGKRAAVNQQCHKCPEVCKNEEVFGNHMKAHELYTNDGEKSVSDGLLVDLKDGMVLKCEPCALVYSSAFLFKKHVLKYHKDVNSCESCKESFPFKHLLFRHGLKEHTIYPKQCSYCEEEKFNAKDMIDHIRQHSNITSDSKIPCDVCGKGFSDKYKLKAHLKTMHENVSETCEYCGQLVSSKRSLENHVNFKHPEEGSPPRLACSICKTGYNIITRR